MKNIFRTRLILCCLLVFAMCQVQTLAGGYAVSEQSGRGLAHAFSGISTGLGDGSSVFFNPAAMHQLEDGKLVSLTINYIEPDGTFNNEGSSLIPQLGGIPLVGGNGGDSGDGAVVPDFYFVTGLGEKWKLGLSGNAPFGLVTEYEADWVGRYRAVKSDLKTLNLNATMAYQVNDRFSLGFGLNYYHIEAELSNALDFGSIAFATAGPQVAAQLGLSPQGSDGFTVLTGDTTEIGFNVGLLYTPSEKTRIGLGYRAEVNGTIDGDVDFTVPQNAQPIFATTFADTPATADFSLPASASLGFSHTFDKVTLMGDVLWTGWESFEELRVKFASELDDSVVDESWDNGIRYSMGLAYQANEKWLLRGGLAIEDTPVPDAEHRTPRIPDQDREWLAFGFTWDSGNRLAVDVSYAHVFADDAELINAEPGTFDQLRGYYEVSADVLAISLVYGF